ncbi:DUF3267 domain-containing protein [Evansella clarkii]|jgi:hypothetical protein|uniref:DUF3267 domain-containing protein n=1 Tax=Evansella clarkii TaxID=79879 RepID=UPI000996C034|nr:DUF3267 domain-containing protein [Evansella clarkii]
MNCWKSISVEKDIGMVRLLFLSALTMMVYFMVYFVFFTTFITSEPLVDYGVLFLTILMVMVFPLHVLLHCLPIWLSGSKARIRVRKQHWPYIYYSAMGTISKQTAILSAIFPGVVITTGSVLVTVTMPHIMHYMAMMSALNIGICVYDFLHMKQLSRAPKKCLVEEHRNGYHILYDNQFTKIRN